MLDRHAATTIAILGTSFAIDAFVPLEYSIWVLYLFAIATSRRSVLPNAIAITTATACVLVVLDMLVGPTSNVRYEIANEILAIPAIVGFGWVSYVQQKAVAKQDALLSELQTATKEIKVLRGMLPICMTCKKIRDESGNWQQLERYLDERAEVQFTHGLCPNCLKAQS